jgi:hypothetical protein
MMKWQQLDEVNEWTGAVQTRYIAQVNTDDKASRAYLQVYEADDRWYWSANIIVVNRPDLSRIAYGTYAAIPGALGVANMRASRLALAALRTCRVKQSLTRAA